MYVGVVAPWGRVQDSRSRTVLHPTRGHVRTHAVARPPGGSCARVHANRATAPIAETRRPRALTTAEAHWWQRLESTWRGVCHLDHLLLFLLFLVLPLGLRSG